jgi:beta-glucosidase
MTNDTLPYRDLNKNGRLDPYEDPRQPIDVRMADLLAQMTLEEKAGLMFHTMLPVGKDGLPVEGMSAFGPASTQNLIGGKHFNHFNIYDSPAPRLLATWHNNVQKLAEGTRLGIPVTISSDPRHAFGSNLGANVDSGKFSKWPEPIGLAALGDAALVQQFADIARQEYLAVGIRVALHPSADLATEPRWARINTTFGEEAALAAKMIHAYVRGIQGEELGPHSVACMTKHFPGGGPQKDGEDPHFSIGKEQVYPGDHFDYHLIPFEAAFAAGTAQIMPYYGMPIGTELEPVGFGFNKQVITGLLRGKYGFDGIVCSDWRLLTDAKAGDRVIMEAKCWGVEHLSVSERAQKAIEAGVDQFGGETCVEVVVDLVRSGQVSEARIDESARRLLREKFRLGLFDNPYVSVDAAEKIIGKPEFVAMAEAAQRRSMVLLKNGVSEPILPLAGKPKLYVQNISADVAAAYGHIVETPDQADYALIRLNTPYEPREGFLESMFHAGTLEFLGKEKQRILELLRTVPTIVCIYLERPAVIPEIAEGAAALLGNFGASDAAVLDVAFGRAKPEGKLPFEMPSSMQAVRQQKEDVPFDSENPLFLFGFGLSY